MGTLFASPGFMERYIKVGAEYKIPVMFPGGNNKLLIECQNYPLIKKLKAEGKWKEGMQLPVPEVVKQAKAVGEKVWQAGLPVLDDLHTISGEWRPEGSGEPAPQAWSKHKVEQFKDAFRRMEPGVAMFIVHCNDQNETFKYISASGGTRYADMLSMMDPELKAFIQSEGIILTTWRELMQRRQRAN
jgi:chitin disaccharide deacetylase